MKRSAKPAALAALLILCASGPALATNGHLLHGSGAVNASLGGAGTARAYDAFGVSVNPATLHGLRNQAAMSLEFFTPNRSLSSSVDAGAFGPSFGPPADLSGSTRSGHRLSILPAMGVVWTPKNSRVGYAAVFQGIAGFGVDYNRSSLFDSTGMALNPKANPILTPQPPNGFGFGHIFSDFKLITLKLAAAAPVNDRLDVGFALIPAMAELQVDPFPATYPVDANADGYPSYPNTGYDKAAGFGFQVGATYRVCDTLRVGLSYQSPIWFEAFKWAVTDEGVSRRKIGFNLDYPAIAGAGLAYDLRPDTAVLLDVRHVFYGSTKGFEDQGFAADGSIAGFGWDDIWVIGTGIQHEINERLRVRAGYNFNTDPIGQRQTFFNVQAPAIIRHRLSFGLGYDLAANWRVDLTYYHAFRERITGPWYGATGAIPGTEVSSAMHEDSGTVQVSWFFGN